MNHEAAADLRDILNSSRYVTGPDEEQGAEPLGLVRVQQPGYLNGKPMYEVLVRVADEESVHLPHDFIELVSDRDCYLRLQDGDVHIRDWEA